MESERPVRPGMTLADLNAANRRTWDGVTMSPALGAKDALSPQEKERYEQLLRRYEGTGFALSDKEMGEFRQLHRKAVGDSAKDAAPSVGSTHRVDWDGQSVVKVMSSGPSGVAMKRVRNGKPSDDEEDYLEVSLKEWEDMVL